ncbi:MAG: SIMPL domain-containing protein [Variibacter sp.]|nr:SIMPL domain-containing protein [Variibacter sp.]
MRSTSWPLAAGCVLAAALALASPARAVVDRPFPLVTVAGEGVVAVKPDLAHVTVGVASEGKTPREAADANAATMTAIMAALKDAGIAESDIRTARFAVSPVYGQRERGSQPRLVGFRVSNQVRATVRDIAKLGEVLDRIVAAGANDISGVDFVASNHSRLLDEARVAAFADAKRRAELLAQAAGAQVGRAVMIAEEEAPPPRPFTLREASAVAAAPTTPIAPGEETLRVRLTVSFELNQ